MDRQDAKAPRMEPNESRPYPILWRRGVLAILVLRTEYPAGVSGAFQKWFQRGNASSCGVAPGSLVHPLLEVLGATHGGVLR